MASNRHRSATRGISAVVGAVLVASRLGHTSTRMLEQHDARVRSWVRASRPELDVQLWRAVTDWLADEWPFERVAYAERADGA